MTDEHSRLTTMKRWAAWGQRRQVYRVVTRYGGTDGNLLAAGMSYRAVFAILAAIWLGFSVAGLWLASNPPLWDSLMEILSSSVPGLIGQDGIISERDLTKISGSFGWSSAFAAVGLIWTSISWLNATRKAVRAMFELGAPRMNALLVRVMDLGLAFSFGVVLIVAAALSAASTALLTGIFEWMGFSAHSFWRDLAVRAAGLLVVVVLNSVALAGMYRILSRVQIPFRRLLVGSVGGSIALAAMSVASGLLLGGAGRNPLVASFAVFLGLLLWFNLVCRVILLAAAWIAVDMKDAGLDPRRLTPEEREHERRLHDVHSRVEDARRDYLDVRDRYGSGGVFYKMRHRHELSKARTLLDAALEDEDRMQRDHADDARHVRE